MDTRIRALERELQESPSISAGVQLLRARLAVGDIKTGDIRGAASLGCSSAINYLDQKPGMWASQSKRFYILLGYAAIHHPDVDELMDRLLIGEDLIEFVTNCDKITEAFLDGERIIELGPRFKTALTISEAARWYQRWDRPHEGISTSFLVQHFEQAAVNQLMGILYHVVGAYQPLMSAINKKPRVRIRICLEEIVEALYWIENSTYFPHVWEFNLPDREWQRQKMMDDQVDALIQDISPAVITRLIGPYLSF